MTCKEKTSLDVMWNTMENELRRGCQVTGVIGYSLQDLTSGRTSKYLEDIVFPTASTIKIAILVALATKISEGALSWEQRYNTKDLPKVGGSGILSLLKYHVHLSIWDLASLMIALSDNDATNACIDLVGMDYINSLMLSFGLPNTKLMRKMMDREAVSKGAENVSTPKELMTLMCKIHNRDGISEQIAEDILTILALRKGGAFSQALPANIKRANKPGGLNHVAVDAGIIYFPQRPVALTVMGCFLESDETPAIVPVTNVVRTAYKHLNIISKCTRYGRG